ncbi:hypothetical protein [Pedobacter immunditicola]|uniref:hypothetical protein n=1 Tax=Pedobacter immunditicola TaxID=3133440 RepID=UPI0030A51EF8
MEPAVSRLKQAIWLYFILLIFEGALRKWIFPSLADPILVIRDPLVLWILIKAWQQGLINFNYYVISMIIIGIVGIYTAYFLGHGNITVALYGARILLLHFPLIFVIGRVLNTEDAIKMGKATLIIAIPMTILIILQFYSPQTALININVGGEAGGGFSGVNKVFRPPGIFSFINGNTLFYSFAACFILYFWFKYKTINRLLLVTATLSLLLAIPFSISRGLLFQVVVSMLFAAVAISMKPKYLTGMLFVIGGLVICFILLGSSSFFRTATEVFSQRFTNANNIEGGISGVLFNRFLGGMLEAIYSSSNQPFFGYGIGMGTNAGSMILKGGRYFLLSEGEWGRIIGELGPIMGMSVIILRIKLALHISYRSYSSLLSGNLLPWMLLSFGVLAIAQGSWSQPTSLGFCTLISGLIIASLKD